MTAIVSEKPGAEFLSNKEYLTKYNGTSKSKHHEVPRHAYFNKAQAFFESHYDKGELHMEFLKGDCLQKDGELCDTCSSAENEWIYRPGNEMHTTHLSRSHPQARRKQFRVGSAKIGWTAKTRVN